MVLAPQVDLWVPMAEQQHTMPRLRLDSSNSSKELRPEEMPTRVSTTVLWPAITLLCRCAHSSNRASKPELLKDNRPDSRR